MATELRRVTLAAAIAAVSGTAWGGSKAETVLRLISLEKADQAREKCEKWEAPAAQDDPDLRNACAKASWPVAEADDSVLAWQGFRSTWAGTEWAGMAFVRESESALRSVGPRKPEGDLIELGVKYAGTKAEAEFRKKAADAAIRDTATPAEAVGVAERYPGHPGLPSLVERFPDGFLDVVVTGRDVAVRTKPEIALPPELEPKARWVAMRSSGHAEPWDDAARRYLQGLGVPDAVLAALPEPGVGPRLPVCWFPGQPPGFAPGVEIRVGGGSAVRPIDYDPGCGPDAWPVFVTLSGDRVVSLSLRPGHRVDLFAPSGPRRDVRAWLPEPSGTPRLFQGAIYLQAGSVWLVHPVSGGTPWATGGPPGPAALPLTGALQGAGVPPDWRLTPRGGDVQVESDKLATMPPALREWVLLSGDLRVLSPLAQQALGLSSKDAMPASKVAPSLGASAGWVRNPDGTVQRLPPSGASVAGITEMGPDDVENALRVAQGVGVSRQEVEPLDGWQVDLDGDRVLEAVVRCTIGKKGAVLVIDPLGGKSAASAADARVFVLSTERVRSDRRAADTPFTFRKGDFVYMAWSGSEVTGATTRRLFLEVVRSDGSGFTSEGFELP